MSNLVDYAKNELKRIGMIDSGEVYNDLAAKAILDLIELFASQGHSGFSASYVINIFSRLVMFKPLSPLTGEDDEWNDIGDGTLQNKRYSAVFKDKDGTVYDTEGKLFTDDGKFWYTCNDSRVNVTFPYVVPDKPEYVYRNILNSQETKYCDRNICIKNEYNGISCDECEVTKSQEPKIGHCKNCRWWKDSDGVFRRGIGAESQCPMNHIEVFMGNGYCYMFEPTIIEVDMESEETNI